MWHFQREGACSRVVLNLVQLIHGVNTLLLLLFILVSLLFKYSPLKQPLTVVHSHRSPSIVFSCSRQLFFPAKSNKNPLYTHNLESLRSNYIRSVATMQNHSVQLSTEQMYAFLCHPSSNFTLNHSCSSTLTFPFIPTTTIHHRLITFAHIIDMTVY